MKFDLAQLAVTTLSSHACRSVQSSCDQVDMLCTYVDTMYKIQARCISPRRAGSVDEFGRPQDGARQLLVLDALMSWRGRIVGLCGSGVDAMGAAYTRKAERQVNLGIYR